jgi:hypothetical protein
VPDKLWRNAQRAVGEAVIITVGVLLALGADEWRQEVERAGREQVLLQELHADFVANAAEVERVAAGHEREWEAAQSLIHALEGDSVLHAPTADVLSRVLLSNWRFDAERGALDSYLNGGDLGLISNPELRSALADWPRRVDEVWQQEARLLEFVDRDARAYLVSESDVLSLVGRGPGSGGGAPQGGRVATPSRVIGQLYRPDGAGAAPLLGDPRLANLASVRLLLGQATVFKVSVLADATTRVLQLLEQELGR